MVQAQMQQKRKGKQNGVRTEWTLVVPVIPGHEQAIQDATLNLFNDPRTRSAVGQIGTLHEARTVMLEGGKKLLFASSFDGDWDPYIDDFFATFVRDAFDAVLAHAEGYPGSADPTVRGWFMQHTNEAISYNVDFPDATVRAIGKALALQAAFQQVLDHPEAEQALMHPALKPLLDFASR